MSKKLKIHYDNRQGYEQPVMVLQQGAEMVNLQPGGQDDYGVWFETEPLAEEDVLIKFGDMNNTQHMDSDSLWRRIPADSKHNNLWARSWNAFVYHHQPRIPESTPADEAIQNLSVDSAIFMPDSGGYFGCGATVLQAGGVLFGLFHSHAAQVYVCGDFNDWQHPGSKNADPDKFYAMGLHRGYFGLPNMWVLRVDAAAAGQEYKFYIDYGALNVPESRLTPDPYTRFLGKDYAQNNSLIINPATYTWQDDDYQTPPTHELILYELSVHGFTHQHPHVDPALQGTFKGITACIKAGYFNDMNVTALSLMPISEVPTPQGEQALGYNTSLFLALERDFGTPDDFREMVDVAHQHGLAIVMDQVFNHAANSWNPLWGLILEHPDHDDAGGLYFSGESPWGNRMATERTETQNMLIDACKLMMHEYHVDGFRFDYTHSSLMHHGFMLRLADEVQTIKPDVILIAENMPNERDLNREGYNGFAQWNDVFHDGMKAYLREGEFEHTDNNLENLGDIFYFAKRRFAAHSNNVVNYCESHDEHSVSHEISFKPELNNPGAKDRKSRLGMFATMVAMGQPMIYMGQEFGVERERNHVYFDFPKNHTDHHFYQWSRGLIGLRHRYPALKTHGYDPIKDGHFHWILGSWLGEHQGHGKRVIGWKATPSNDPTTHLVIMMNFENHSVKVDVPFGRPGKWVRLASIDSINDVAPYGTAAITDKTTIDLSDAVFEGFVLPDSSGFIYKWHAE